MLRFIETHGFPVVVKPTLSCASDGIFVLKDQADVENYFEKEFYSELNDKVLDHPGDMMVEQFISMTMYHVNGYASFGEIIYAWPFQYKNTNLDFTRGAEYGNVSLTPAFADADHVFFHCEMFGDGKQFLLCEIAARKPG